MASIRQQKISRLIQRDLAKIFQEESKTMFDNAMVTVTHVKVSPDLSIARVHVSLFGRKSDEEYMELIRKQSGKIRGMLGNKIRHQVRNIPELHFYLDDSLDRAEYIDELLNK